MATRHVMGPRGRRVNLAPELRKNVRPVPTPEFHRKRVPLNLKGYRTSRLPRWSLLTRIRRTQICCSLTSTRTLRALSSLPCEVLPDAPDRSCVSVGTRKGYSITNCDPFGRVFTSSVYASLALCSLRLNPRSRRWGQGHCRDALLYISDCSSRSCRSTTVKSAEIADREYQGALDD